MASRAVFHLRRQEDRKRHQRPSHATREKSGTKSHCDQDVSTRRWHAPHNGLTVRPTIGALKTHQHVSWPHIAHRTSNRTKPSPDAPCSATSCGRKPSGTPPTNLPYCKLPHAVDFDWNRTLQTVPELQPRLGDATGSRHSVTRTQRSSRSFSSTGAVPLKLAIARAMRGYPLPRCSISPRSNR